MTQLEEFRRQLEERRLREDEREKTMRKERQTRSAEPKAPARTSISLSVATFARLDSYKFWLRRHSGKDYPSYSALIDDLLDKVLSADEKAAAFVKKHGSL